MAKNVMKLLKPSPHRARNDFDLSHRHLFDANFGELLPCTCIETVPGDNITLHASDLIRNIPLVTSMFLRAKQHIDVWFVPYRDLWHQFDSFVTKKKEPVSSALQSADFCPYMDVNQLSGYINSAAGSPYSLKDVVGRSLTDRSFYLLQLLGYGNLSSMNGTGNFAKVNPFRLAAYNYIWYNEYRQQYYDDGSLNLGSLQGNPAVLFNFDDLNCGTQAAANVFPSSDSASINRAAAMSQMRYRCWKKDLFTGVLPSTQFGAVSTVTSQLVDPVISFNSPGNISNVYTDADVVNSGGFVGLRQSGQTTGSLLRVNSSDSRLNILDLRKSEAIQIWRENALRAGNHVKDNMMAHFGVASDFQDHRPTFLGSVSAPVNISDVVSTASTGAGGGNDTLGDIAGKGLSSLSEKVFKFHAKEFGVIMAVFSVLPEGEYEANGIERTNQLLEAEDFFMPEYENLGLEAVSAFNFGAANQLLGYNKVVGYAPRYYAYKTKLDKVFGEFCGTGVFRQWASQRNDIDTYLNTPNWLYMSLSLLYVNPAVYNGHFILDLSNSPQFLCDIYFDVDAVRPMSVMGLPFS